MLQPLMDIMSNRWDVPTGGDGDDDDDDDTPPGPPGPGAHGHGGTGGPGPGPDGHGGTGGLGPLVAVGDDSDSAVPAPVVTLLEFCKP